MENPSRDDLRRRQEWQALKERLELEAETTVTQSPDEPTERGSFNGRQSPEGLSSAGVGPQTYGSVSYPPQYAGFWLRTLATIIDSLIFTLVGFILGFAVGMMGGSAKSVDIPLFIANWLYYAFLESSPKQGTIGKMVVGLSVTDKSGNRISFARATGRYFAKIISGLTFCIGYIMAAFTSKKQGLHDIMASTLVVKN